MVCTPQHFLQLQLTLNAHNQRQENIQIMYAEYNAWGPVVRRPISANNPGFLFLVFKSIFSDNFLCYF